MKPYRALLVVVGLSVAAATSASADTKPTNAVGNMLPDRYLQCVLGRSTNVDPKKFQKSTDIVSEGRYRLSLRLPPGPAHRGEEPDPSDPIKPVDPRTKIVYDPNGLTKGVSPQFFRVEDVWPKRVEMLATIASSRWIQFFVIDPIDPIKKRARLFMAPVKDAATMDLARIYQGECTITGRPAEMTRR